MILRSVWGDQERKLPESVEQELGKSTYKNRFREGRKGSFLFDRGNSQAVSVVGE